VSKPQFVTIKEIASRLDVSDDTVRRNLKRFFDPEKCRDRTCLRPKRFLTVLVEAEMKKKRIWVTF
jgi:predicted ArsR family transcriptional regulator